jgi:hypothetical protein
MEKFLIKILDFMGVKEILKKKYFSIKSLLLQFVNNHFNRTVVKQNKDLKSIPIIIISFNQLFYLKKLVEFLKLYNYNNIVIIDNNSTYPPLLEYFEEMESTLIIHRLEENYGHLVFWKNKELFNKYSKGYYVVTDPDINPILECPENFIAYFKNILDEDYKVSKVGFSLKIDDIPDSNVNKYKILKWESRYWKFRRDDGNYQADIDTTFALYRPGYMRKEKNFIKGIRTQYPYQVKHGGWYIDLKKLSEEEKYYIDTCNDSSSWRVDELGVLKNHFYKK